MRKGHVKIAGLFFLSLMAAGAATRADDIVNVVEQARYPMLADGIRSGSLIFSPSLAVNQTYEDNVYRDPTDEESDFVTVISPGLSIATDFDLHSLFFRTSASLGYYHTNDTENFENYSIAGGGRLDVDYGTFFTLNSSYRQLHETRDDPDAANVDEPVEYSLINNKLGFTRALGIIKLYVEGLFDRFEYQNSTINGTLLDNGGRDRNIYTASGKLSYEYLPAYNVYVQMKQDWRRYDESGAVTRDSAGYEIVTGTDVAITGKVKGDIYVGYLERNYDDSTLEDIDTVNYGGSLIWNLTGLTSLSAGVDRGVEETTFGDASGKLQTRFNVGIDHILRHNLFLGADASYFLSDYETGRNENRKDDNYRAGVDLEYMPYNGTSIRAAYDYTMRDSNVAGEDYTNNRFTLGLSHAF